MSYNPTIWENGKTPINDENLNNIEKGIVRAHEIIADHDKKIDDFAKGQMPEEYVKSAVDTYIEENEAGLATKEDIGSLSSEIENNIIANEQIVTTSWERGSISAESGNETTSEEYKSAYMRSEKILCKNARCIVTNAPANTYAYLFAFRSSGFISRIGIHSGLHTWTLPEGTTHIRNVIRTIDNSHLDESVINDFSCKIISDFLITANNLVSREEILGRWKVADTIYATLYANGDFIFSGYGNLNIPYSSDNIPPWCSAEYLSNVKKIIFGNDITYDSINYLFYNPNFRYGIVNSRIDVPKDATLSRYAFNGILANHINYAKCENATNWITNILPTNASHCIFSVPSAIVTDALIENICSDITNMYGNDTNINTGFNTSNDDSDGVNDSFTGDTNEETESTKPNVAYGVALIITDSIALRDAIHNRIGYGDNIESAIKSDNGQRQNVSVIYCDSLGIDGFPSTWTRAMKNAIGEIIPYVGRHYETFYLNDDIKYVSTGITGLSPYSRMGIPNPYAINTETDIMVYDDGKKVYKTVNVASYFSGKPYNASLEVLTSGLDCAGFVDWMYWRYFKENFGLATVSHLYYRKGTYGQWLPLDILSKTKEQENAITLKPFDIIVYKSENGNHAGIFLGYDKNGKKHVIHQTGAYGLTFGRWNDSYLSDDEKSQYGQRVLRSYKQGISLYLLN